MEKTIVNVATQLYRFDDKGGVYVIGGKCKDCGAEFFPKERFCQNCMGENIDDLPLPTEGKLYSMTTVVAAPAGFEGPYMIGFADLGDFRIYGMIQGDDVKIGDKVHVEYGVIRETEDTIEKGYIYHKVEEGR